MEEIESIKIVQVLCSSYYISHYANDQLSVSELSVDLYKLEEIYKDELENGLKEFDGYSIKDIQSATFKTRKNRLENKLNDLVTSLKEQIPKPITVEVDSKETPYQIDETFIQETEHPIIQKWFNKYRHMGGQSCFEFKQSKLKEVRKKLKEIARYKTKLDAMNYVRDEANLEGFYQYSKVFNRVADACRWLSKEMEEPTFKKYLDQVRGERIAIQKDGTEITDKEKLYNQTYSWWQNQRAKGDEIPKK